MFQTSNTLRFEGPTQLLRWNNRRQAELEPDTEIVASKGIWNLETGDLGVNGPVRALRNKDLEVTASALKGNTQKGFLDLVQPVRLEQNEADINAGTTRWNLADQRFTSSARFQGKRQDATATGIGFVIDEATTTVIIPKACRLSQPGELLTAQRCSWNWLTNRVVADGDVVLRRQEPLQKTRAPRMEGQLGSSEGVRFGSSGQRVRSSIRFTPDQPGSAPRRRGLQFRSEPRSPPSSHCSSAWLKQRSDHPPRITTPSDPREQQALQEGCPGQDQIHDGRGTRSY